MNSLKHISKLRLTRISLVAGLLIVLGLAAGWSHPNDDQIMPALGLESGELITINPEQIGKSEIPVQINGQDYVIEYAFHSVRSGQFRLMVQQENGELVQQEAPAVRTIRGALRGVAGSRVIGSLTDGGLSAKIKFPTGENYFIQPVDRTIDDPALAGVHVVYETDEVIPIQGQCGTETIVVQSDENVDAPSIAAAGILQECELALDSDFEYFSIFNSVSGTLAEMELIINVMNDQYETEVAIRHTVTDAVIRPTSNNAPFTSTNSNDLLDEFRNFHLSSGINGDLVHLFTGKDLDGNIIGLAFVGVVCNQDFRFGLSQELSLLSNMTDLTAHELGHNWNQSHCSCSENTMNASLTGTNDFNDAITVPNLISYRDTVPCLDTVMAPDNDDWIDETFIADPDFSVTGSNVNATTQEDEQTLTIVGSTAWWFVDSDEDGSITIDTFGSDFDTQLQVFEFVPGAGFAGLILVASNDDASGGLQSRVTFDMTAGTCYEIRVGGFRGSQRISDGSEGNIVLSGAFVPEAVDVLIGDVNLDGEVDFADISSFIAALSSGTFQAEADTDENGVVNFADISGFIAILSGT